ncbi:MAG: dockerin type I repeat-containing protein [Prevotella sp.]|nr:dockerin type I repeat-containing protein [Prevotella sp.]
MKTNTTNNTLRSVLLCLVAMMASLTALADNKLYIEDFFVSAVQKTIIVDEEEISVEVQQGMVAVSLQNTDVISSVGFDMVLPEGVTVIEGSVVKNTARMNEMSHNVFITVPNEAKPNEVRVTVLPVASDLANTALVGNDGVLFSFKVEAPQEFASGEVVISEVMGSDATVAPAKEIAVEGAGAGMKTFAGSFSVAPEAIAMNVGQTATVDVYVSNAITISGFEATLNLPEGITVSNIVLGENFAGNTVSAYTPTTGKLTISSLTGKEFAESEAPVFSLVLKAETTVAGELTIGAVSLAHGEGMYAVEGESSVDVEATILMGDVNLDGELSFADVNMINNKCLDNVQEGFFEAAADMNGDGEVSFADANALINVILSK